MTDDRSLERAARSWVEAGPRRAPDHVVEAALLRIQTTPQERGLRALRLPWRRQTVNRFALFGATAAVAVAIGVGGFLLMSRSGNPGVGGEPGSTPSPGPSGSQAAVPAIPPGTYATQPMAVADIRAQLDAEELLTDEDKTAIVEDVLRIDGRSTLATYMVVGDEGFDLRLSRDGGPPMQDTPFSVTWVDDQTFLVRSACCGDQTYGVTWEGDSYRLVARSPAGGNVEQFVRRILFESQPFAPVP